MLKILTTRQIKDLDAYTIADEPVASIDLMERASTAFVNWFMSRFDRTKKIGIICGTGNNGGDGLGIARLLTEWNYTVRVWLVQGSKKSEDFQKNLQRLTKKIDVQEIISDPDQALFAGCDILIDALFGSGLSRPVEGVHASVINAINASGAICVAVDIPSGLLMDGSSTGAIVKAEYTISFQLPKLPFLLPENNHYVGAWSLVDIGLSKQYLREVSTELFYLTLKDIKKIIKPRSRFDHKGTYGHALLIAGSYGKMGACILSAKAALRAGVGLLTVHVPMCGYTILQTAVPEAMVSVDQHDKCITSIPGSKYQAQGIGPGIGQSPETIKAFTQVLMTASQPVVIDADGLNILATHRELLHAIPVGSILTPHPKEFERLAGKWKNDFERLQVLKQFSVGIKSVVVLKGAYTSIATPDGNVYFNSTGNPGMATGGSGDVLTGIITGLLAQGYSPEDSAKAGVYLHGLAGDLAAKEESMHGLIASDLVEWLPKAFHMLD